MTTNNEMLSNAIAFAANKHKNQFDKAGMPYILHCLKVMHYLKTEDIELMCIAVLHDVIEDTDALFIDLTNIGMSERVVAGVDCMTKHHGQSLEDYKATIKSNKDAIYVKMADLRHNSDIRRLKVVTEKDIQRTVKYQKFYKELEDELAK